MTDRPRGARRPALIPALIPASLPPTMRIRATRSASVGQNGQLSPMKAFAGARC